MSIVPLERFLTRRFGDVRSGWTILHRRLLPQRLDRLTGYLMQMKREDTMSDFKVEVPGGDDLTVTLTRTFDAPRALVWKVMTDPQHIVRWWTARSVSESMTIDKHDMRPGGAWRFISHGRDGNDYTFVGKFLEITPPEKVVQTFGMEGMFEGKTIIETMTLTEVGGRTLYKNVSLFESREDRDGMVASGMEFGARQTLDQLAEILAEQQAAQQQQ